MVIARGTSPPLLALTRRDRPVAQSPETDAAGDTHSWQPVVACMAQDRCSIDSDERRCIVSFVED
jgi:hypothetical protein